MSSASFHFHGNLERFIARERHGAVFQYECARAATLKQAVESLGVPHTEVGRLIVNGQAATLARIAREGDVVEVFPHEPGTAPFEEPLAFLADAHLGGLARMLRMLGFDTVYDQALHDPQVVERSAAERRVVLTRDRELLKCKDVLRGCFVHALKPEAQLREVALRYDIAGRMRPFSRCLHCNLPLEPAEQQTLGGRVPERILASYPTSCAAPAAIASIGKARTGIGCAAFSRRHSTCPFRASADRLPLIAQAVIARSAATGLLRSRSQHVPGIPVARSAATWRSRPRRLLAMTVF